MSSSRVSTGITWSSSSSVTVSSSTPVTSDAFSLNVEDWECDLWVKADNQGTPAAGDVCDVYIAYAADGSNYDTTEHAFFLFRLDTVAANTPGEDPAMASVPIRTASPSFKIIVSCPQSASRNMVVTAGVGTHRPQ